MSFSKWALGDCGCCGCTVRVCVVACSDATPVSAANVSLWQGGVSLVSCATGSDGCCSLSISGADDYEVRVIKTGYVTYKKIHTLGCGDTVTVGFSGVATVTFHILSDCTVGAVDLMDATVVLAGISELTNSSGRASFGVTDTGTYSWTASKTRYTSQSGTVTLSYCAPASPGPSDIFLLPATGYHCGPSVNCDSSARDPVTTDTLNLTDSVYGATTIAYDSTDGHWRGTNPNSFGGACGFPAGTGATLIKYDFDPGGNGGKGSVRIGIYNIALGTTSFFTGSVTGCTTAGVLDWTGTRAYCATPGVCDGTLQCAMYLTGVTITITE